ncbi:thiosulfate sulfurtransferase-like [Mercenaria mercenaria]|uniref:thiosulfate sulfurtransferase-like n=1 Tax=Mercenaria mercenaria TaxID=6596 RepID=UPI001E1D3FE0|nr:thiosulfate sulfurtransferase-like [Mercenaria mercenaria]XP_053375432.1 thiosulfate sulfurtransferase-like [Mercenaria mercenaria]
MAVPQLVSCEWLNERIKSGNLDKIVIVDVSWASTKDCRQDYNKQHIQGARYIDVLSAEHTDMYPRNIPTVEAFTLVAQQAGINSDSHIIVYSNSDRAGYFMAGRGWWTFRHFGHKNVSILDGGLSKWLQLGYPTTDQCTDIQPGNFVASIDESVYRSYDEVKDNVKTDKFQVLDTRPNTAHTESSIPGAKNVFMADLVDNERGTLKSEDELRQVFSSAGVDLSQPLVTHCYSGMSSCAVAFTAELLGAKQVSVFHGGFTEWKKKQGEDK